MHKGLDEFEFQKDPTTDYRVSYPWASEKSIYNVNTLAQAFGNPIFGRSSPIKKSSDRFILHQT